MADEDEWARIDKVRFALYGGAVTLLMDIVIYPLEVLKTKMMIDTKVSGLKRSAPVTCVREHYWRLH
jgi:hypothetical protein